MSKKTKELRKRAKAAKRAAKKEKSGLQVDKFSFRPELSISSLRGLPPASRHSADCEAQSAPLSAAAA
jgi:hypothetical protein